MDLAPDTVADIVIRLRAIEVKEGRPIPIPARTRSMTGRRTS